jgi:hypothetical protein
MRAALLIATGLVATLGGLGTVAPATAQANRVLTIFGNDKCPTSNGEEIVVCNRLPEADRYRIPEGLRATNNIEPAAQRRVDTARLVDNSTIGTCSTSGPGGMIGCQRQEFAKARAENKAKAAAVPVID